MSRLLSTFALCALSVGMWACAPTAHTVVAQHRWPLNGVVHNGSSQDVIGVSLNDGGQRFVVQPGTRSPGDADVDFVRVQGIWYKLRAFSFQVGADGGADPFIGFRPATRRECAWIATALAPAS